MPKKKRTFAERKKAALQKKTENEYESLCRRCGLCCHIKIGLVDGTYVIHPTKTCKYLTEENLCSVYRNRFDIGDTVICFRREDMISKDHILPEGCPYAELRPGYKPARIVTQSEFDRIIVEEIESGNYNILLVDRVF
ncbi:MAG: hypothetical protein AB1552_05890 [Nitrospirota bacterium]